MVQLLDADVIRENIAVVPLPAGVQIEFHACGWDFEMAFTSIGQLTDFSMLPALAQGENDGG